MRLATGLVAGALLTVGIIAVTVNGCNAQPLEGYCNLDKLADQAIDKQACHDCLFANTQCCDAVGECAEAGAGCEDLTARELACVVDAGRLGLYQEPGCLSDATAPSSASYGCVKDRCAVACGIGAAACKPDPAIPNISNPSCDRCTTTKCCLSLNSCYQSRPCKVAFECFVGCGTEFEGLFRQPDAGAFVRESVKQLCNGGRPAFFESASKDLPCIKKCVVDYILPLNDAGVDAAAGPGCESLSLFGCAYDECQSSCVPEDQDAGQDGAATDASDAGASDAADAGD